MALVGWGEPDPAVLFDMARCLEEGIRGADQEFLAIGAVLSEAISLFDTLPAQLRDLSSHLTGAAALRSDRRLEEAVAMLGEVRESDSRGFLLSEVERDVQEIRARFQAIARVTVEIDTLAINAKVQASLVSTRTEDFTVFTQEIGRLGGQAAEAVVNALRHIEELLEKIAAARAAMTDFEATHALELNAVQQRLSAGRTTLAERRGMAANAAALVERAVEQVRSSIANTVAGLQINDSFCQRLDHVARVLRALFLISAGEPIGDASLRGLTEILAKYPDQAFSCLVLLQEAQLLAAAEDYEKEVEVLAVNMEALGGAADAMVRQARDTFGVGGGALFVGEVTDDVSRALGLLDRFTATRRQMGEVLEAVSDGILVLETQLAMIESIDADLRIMGLNATLKCGRLGGRGGSLKVIAQNLRACSDRAADATGRIGASLRLIVARRQALSSSGEESGFEAGAIAATLTEFIETYRQIGQVMQRALDSLCGAGAETALSLKKSAAGVTIHSRLGGLCRESSGRLSALAPQDGEEFPAALQGAVQSQLAPLYTMNAERDVHRRLSGGAFEEAAPAADLDDLFF